MRFAVLGDVHLIADHDPCGDYLRLREPFVAGVPAFRRAVRWLDTLGLDAVFSVGDLIDWHSEANVALAAEVMSQLRCPWHLTPGNHDLSVPKAADGRIYDNHGPDVHRAACSGRWHRHGVALHDRRVHIDGWDLWLLDSSSGRVDEAACSWMHGGPPERTIVLTHVPFDRAPIRDVVVASDGDRDLRVYVQHGSPITVADSLEGRVATVFSGHLHLPGRIADRGTTFHLLDASFARGPRPPTITVVEDHRGQLRVEAMAAAI